MEQMIIVLIFVGISILLIAFKIYQISNSGTKLKNYKKKPNTKLKNYKKNIKYNTLQNNYQDTNNTNEYIESIWDEIRKN